MENILKESVEKHIKRLVRILDKSENLIPSERKIRQKDFRKLAKRG